MSRITVLDPAVGSFTFRAAGGLYLFDPVLDEARRLKDLEQENARLRKAAAKLTLGKLILKEVASGNF